VQVGFGLSRHFWWRQSMLSSTPSCPGRSRRRSLPSRSGLFGSLILTWVSVRSSSLVTLRSNARVLSATPFLCVLFAASVSVFERWPCTFGQLSLSKFSTVLRRKLSSVSMSSPTSPGLARRLNPDFVSSSKTELWGQVLAAL
jgi:hypothetical protein